MPTIVTVQRQLFGPQSRELLKDLGALSFRRVDPHLPYTYFMTQDDREI